MIDLKNKVVFVHVPNCAGTSVENYFMQIRGLDHRNRAGVGIFKNDKLADLEHGNQHCTLSTIEEFWFGGEILQDFRIFTICVILVRGSGANTPNAACHLRTGIHSRHGYRSAC